MPIRGASYVKEERGARLQRQKNKALFPKRKKRLKKREQSKRYPRSTKYLYFFGFLFPFFFKNFFFFLIFLYFLIILFYFSNFKKNKLIPMGTYCAPKPTAATNGRIGFGD
jgi:hypothetical protein